MPQNTPLTPELVRYFEFMYSEHVRINHIDKRVGKKAAYNQNHPFRRGIKKEVNRG